eukprot:TRINITY_DN4789_c0_g1_i1.p1 TRINITY_DN4789_c0_g1~~TRINITY_DN4789_c0_g1_i1.p1  ORF type:complete len:181 (-),score=44.84 TRINITY_DN4789_c0_g1_i1:242-784(-)
MRPLTEEETKTFFEKLAKFIGKNIARLIQRKDGKYCFRLQKQRIYYLNEDLLKHSTNFGKKELAAVGTCFGKFTKSGKFHLKITCLDYLAQYAEHKVWLRPSGELSFLHGHNVPKQSVGRMSDGIPQYAGVIIFSMQNDPLGFGVAAQATDFCRTLEPTANVVLHQSDVGEYLRIETEIC